MSNEEAVFRAETPEPETNVEAKFNASTEEDITDPPVTNEGTNNDGQ